MKMTNEEEKVFNILNIKNTWTSMSDLVKITNIDSIEIILYLLQMRGLIRISIDEVKSEVKVITENSVKGILENRKDTVVKDMEETMENAAEEEDYEQAAKIRDWIQTSNDNNNDELIKKLLEDIELDN